MEIPSYPKIYNVGHAAIADLFSVPIIVQEKIDGSQFSFLRNGDNLVARSKGVMIDFSAPGMFLPAITSILQRKDKLQSGYIYRGEFLSKPKHNALAYDRIPADHIIIYDIQEIVSEAFLSVDDVKKEAADIGYEVVPLLYEGVVSSAEKLKELLDRTSVLGGQKIEGVVAKPWRYDLYGQDAKVLMGKYVSESFREVHKKKWREGDHAQGRHKVDILLDGYRTPARWNKAIQHLKDRGELENSPRDIGKLLIEIQKDLAEECRDEIQHELWKIFKKDLMRKATSRFPEWYKEQLLQKQFGGSNGGTEQVEAASLQEVGGMQSDNPRESVEA